MTSTTTFLRTWTRIVLPRCAD